MKKRILLVEDEPAIRQLLLYGLQDQYQCIEAGTLAQAKTILQQQIPDLVLLDWMLPDGSGIKILEDLRKIETLRYLPVIMLTARADERDIIKGLDYGADDYLTKPFSMAELQSRIKALFRRMPESEEEQSCLSWEDITMNLLTYEVFFQDKLLKLNRREFQLLECFLRHPNKVLSREQLLDFAWQGEEDIGDRAVDVAIRRLRKAFENIDEQLPVMSIRGIGYRLGQKN
ncbi:response regulator [Dichelobacter nodosus]|uniref:response regulator n=1 Tax=Dichelobacter nodosus TaxID=870 RepID=UPI000E299AD3|nr:response regulator [Dichelobacter nodosus]AXM45697.1 response regulator [Dichelobacter nodosus]